MSEKPLILLTNDDGIASAGLWAAAEPLSSLGELLIVAPDRQWSGAGRSMPISVTGDITEQNRWVAGQQIRAYAVDASPALCIVHGIMELAPRKPALVISGINFGENVSTEITISGTVGAALEAAAFGIPGLALSLEMPIADHLSGGEKKNYAACQAFTRRFARQLLTRSLPYDVNVLNVNVPADATPETPWALTRLSRQRYFIPVAPERENGNGRPGYAVMDDPTQVDPGTDVWTLHVQRMVSVTPLSTDLTSRADFGVIAEELHRLP